MTETNADQSPATSTREPGLLLMAEIMEVVRQCGEQFRMYERSHRDKRSPDGDQKAFTNQVFAVMCENAIAARLRAGAPAGYVVVSWEPTEAMLATWGRDGRASPDNPGDAWDRFLVAATQAAGKSDPGPGWRGEDAGG